MFLLSFTSLGALGAPAGRAGAAAGAAVLWPTPASSANLLSDTIADTRALKNAVACIARLKHQGPARSLSATPRELANTAKQRWSAGALSRSTARARNRI
jgi:hypothetical protein